MPKKSMDDLANEHRANVARRRAEFREPRFTLGFLARAFGANEDTLRSRFNTNADRLGFRQSREGGQWRRFSVRDAVVVATTVEVAKFFIPSSDPLAIDIVKHVERAAEELFAGVVFARVPKTEDLVIAHDGDALFVERWSPAYDSDEGPTTYLTFNVPRFVVGVMAQLGIHAAVGNADDMRRKADQIEAEERKGKPKS